MNILIYLISINIYMQDSWNCFWYIMFSLILQCCISFLVTLLPAYLKGTVWLWILQKQMYKRSCTMSQMWRPRRLGTSVTSYKLTNIPASHFDVSALPGNIGSTLPPAWGKMKEMKEMKGLFTILICDQCSSEGPFKRGLRNFAWTVTSKIRDHPSVLLALGVSSWAPKAYSTIEPRKKKELLHFQLRVDSCPIQRGVAKLLI